MLAKIRFTGQPVFNQAPNRLAVPGILIGRAEDRSMWTMSFTVTQQLNAVEFIGDLQWLVAPIEQDFGKGVKFVLIANPKAYSGRGAAGVLAQGELLG